MVWVRGDLVGMRELSGCRRVCLPPVFWAPKLTSPRAQQKSTASPHGRELSQLQL